MRGFQPEDAGASAGRGWRIGPPVQGGYSPQSHFDFSPRESELLNELISRYSQAAGEQGEVSKSSSGAFLRSILKSICVRRSLLLEKARAEKMVAAASSQLLGFAPIDSLLADDSVEEIAAIGEGMPIYAYKRGAGWLATNCFIESGQYATDLINKMARPLGRHVNLQNPRLNAMLPDGSRLHATIAPLASAGFEFSIRKFRSSPYGIPELVSNGTLSAPAAALLSLACFADVSVIVAGNTGSGKTTTLNSLFSFIPLGERVVIAEETPEINIPHPHSVRIVSNEQLQVGLTDLVGDTLRMRPDRVVIGEVRTTKEAYALADSLQSGQARGSYCTFHARSCNDAIRRLSALAGDGGAELRSSIDIILVQKRVPLYDEAAGRAFEGRRVTQACFYPEGGRGVEFISYDFKSGRHLVRNCDALFSRLSSSYGGGVDGIRSQLRLRTRFIEEAAKAGITLGEFTSSFQKKFYGIDLPDQSTG